MSLFNSFSRGREEANQRYVKIREQVRVKAVNQAREKQVEIPTESFKIAEIIDISRKKEYKDYLDVANFLLAEYPTELGFYVANAFTNLAPQLGYDPFGKIMLATQYVDRLAGYPIMTKFSFIKEHPKFYEFMTEKDCPERTDKALEFLVTAVFQFPDAGHATKIFPTLFVVPEMKQVVKDKLYLLDEVVAKYITK